MLTDLKNLLSRTAPTLMQDAVGAAALFVMLVVGLNLTVYS